MVKLKGLITELFGKKYVIQTTDGNYPTLLSKNTKPNERSWKLTVFDAYSYETEGELRPITHMDIDENEAGVLAATDKLSQRISYGLTMWLGDVKDCDFKGIVPM